MPREREAPTGLRGFGGGEHVADERLAWGLLPCALPDETWDVWKQTFLALVIDLRARMREASPPSTPPPPSDDGASSTRYVQIYQRALPSNNDRSRRAAPSMEGSSTITTPSRARFREEPPTLVDVATLGESESAR